MVCAVHQDVSLITCDLFLDAAGSWAPRADLQDEPISPDPLCPVNSQSDVRSQEGLRVKRIMDSAFFKHRISQAPSPAP